MAFGRLCEVAAFVAQRDHGEALFVSNGTHIAARAEDARQFFVRLRTRQDMCNGVYAALVSEIRASVGTGLHRGGGLVSAALASCQRCGCGYLGLRG